MKKVILLSLGMLATSQVFAQAAQNGICPAAANATYQVQANSFVVRSFPLRCSNNVAASVAETAVAFGVGTLSTKGKSYFQGTTGGGAITGTNCGTTCTAGQEQTGLSAAVNAAT